MVSRKRQYSIKLPSKYFFGWQNIRWFIREVGKMYSGQPSYFSKKRMESGISFLIGQIGMIMFFALSYSTLSMYDFIMWASLEFAVGGYITYQIQRQKRYFYDENSSGNYGDWGNQSTPNDRYTDGPGEYREDDPEPRPPGSTDYPM